MVESLVFALIPDIGKPVRFDTLESGVVEVRKLIREVDYSVFREEGVRRHRQWFVRDLGNGGEAGAPTIGIFAPDGTGALERRTNQTIIEGVREIASGDVDSPPPFFSEPELNSLIALRKRVIAKGLRRIDLGFTEVSQVSILPTIEDQVNRILRGTIDALGSLDGTLEAVNIRHQPYFTMWDRMTGQAVRCSFERSRLDEIRSLLGRRVRVSGVIRYFANGRPRSISRVERIKDIDPIPHTGIRRNYWGSVPTLAAGADSVELLRSRLGDE